MAWVGQALVQLYLRSGRPRVSERRAQGVGEWIQGQRVLTNAVRGWLHRRARGSRVASGSCGSRPSTTSTCTRCFTLAGAGERGEQGVERTGAQWARGFVEAMWDPVGGVLLGWAATKTASRSTTHVLPEDVNSWSYLALQDAAFAGLRSSWDVEEPARSRGRGFSGVSFCRGRRARACGRGDRRISPTRWSCETAAGDAAAGRGLPRRHRTPHRKTGRTRTGSASSPRRATDSARAKANVRRLAAHGRDRVVPAGAAGR